MFGLATKAELQRAVASAKEGFTRRLDELAAWTDESIRAAVAEQDTHRRALEARVIGLELRVADLESRLDGVEHRA